MPRYELESERLGLRRFRLEDLDNLLKLDADPEVMSGITGAPRTRAQTEASLARILAQCELTPGYGVWAAEERASGGFVGNFLLRPMHDGEIELGFRIVRDRWGRGYATEGGRLLLEYALHTLRVPRVVALARSDNLRSLGTLAKLGFTFERELDIDDPSRGISARARLYAVHRKPS